MLLFAVIEFAPPDVDAVKGLIVKYPLFELANTPCVDEVVSEVPRKLPIMIAKVGVESLTTADIVKLVAACATKSLDSVATVWVWLTRIPKSSLPGIGMQSLPHCDRIAVRRFDEAEPSSMMAW